MKAYIAFETKTHTSFSGRTKSATFESARNLALGIGIQNFPEGVVSTEGIL